VGSTPMFTALRTSHTDTKRKMFASLTKETQPVFGDALFASNKLPPRVMPSVEASPAQPDQHAARNVTSVASPTSSGGTPGEGPKFALSRI
jgi:hypothetical protein